MKKVTIAAEARSVHGSARCRGLRRQGRIPAVVYGRKIAPQSLQLKAEDVLAMIRQGQRMVDLTTPAGAQKVFIRDVQYNSTGDHVIHIDFNQVALDEELTLEVSVEVTGTPVGVTAEGGVLNQYVKVVSVRCLPDAIPEKLTADVSGMKLDQNLLARELKMPPGVTLVTSPEVVVASVRLPIVEEVTTPAAAAEAGPAEPEVIGRKVAKKEKAEKGGEEKEKK
jgi:large subunit ribosomal protein L25